MEWLKRAAQRIEEMELERKRCVMAGEFNQATSLLKAIKFARAEFWKVSQWLRKK